MKYLFVQLVKLMATTNEVRNEFPQTDSKNRENPGDFFANRFC